MPLEIKRGYRQLVAEAEKEIETLSIADALALHGDDGVVFVDLRDVRELKREGFIPGAFHCPRGMLEFRADPESPYHDPELRKDRPVILHCASGGRAALAGKLLKEMGFETVYNLGGLKDWKEGGGPGAQGFDTVIHSGSAGATASEPVCWWRGRPRGTCRGYV